MWYFEESDVVLWRGWCGTWKRVMWHFEEGGVVLWRGWCGTLKRVVWYLEKGDVALVEFLIIFLLSWFRFDIISICKLLAFTQMWCKNQYICICRDVIWHRVVSNIHNIPEDTNQPLPIIYTIFLLKERTISRLFGSKKCHFNWNFGKILNQIANFDSTVFQYYIVNCILTRPFHVLCIQRNIDRKRILFLPRLISRSDHLERLAAMDIMVDTAVICGVCVYVFSHIFKKIEFESNCAVLCWSLYLIISLIWFVLQACLL